MLAHCPSLLAAISSKPRGHPVFGQPKKTRPRGADDPPFPIVQDVVNPRECRRTEEVSSGGEESGPVLFARNQPKRSRKPPKHDSDFVTEFPEDESGHTLNVYHRLVSSSHLS